MLAHNKHSVESAAIIELFIIIIIIIIIFVALWMARRSDRYGKAWLAGYGTTYNIIVVGGGYYYGAGGSGGGWDTAGRNGGTEERRRTEDKPTYRMERKPRYRLGNTSHNMIKYARYRKEERACLHLLWNRALSQGQGDR